MPLGPGPGLGPLGGASSLPFDPTQIAGLLAWWKADAITGTSDGATLTVWPDSSSGGRTTSSAGGVGATTSPIYKTGIQNGLPSVRFGPTTDILVFPATAALTDFTVVVALAFTNFTATHSYLGGDQSTNIAFLRQNSSTVFDMRDSTGASFVNLTHAALTTAARSMTIRRSGTAVQVWTNGTSLGTLTAANAYTFARLGNRSSGTNSLGADLLDLVIYNSALSTTDRQSVESYYRSKYALP